MGHCKSFGLALSSHLQAACNNIASIFRLNLVSPTIMSRDVHARVHRVSTPNSTKGDHLAPGHKQTLHKGSLAPCKDDNAASYSTTTSHFENETLEPHVDLVAQFTPIFRSFYPAFILVSSPKHEFYPVLPSYYTNGVAFALILPHLYPGFHPGLPSFYPDVEGKTCNFYRSFTTLPHHIVTLLLPCFHPHIASIFYAPDSPIFTPFLI